MKICVIGTGYVGLVAGACFAETGNDVICMDVNENKISLLKKGSIHIYEPGLEEMIQKNLQGERIQFTTDLLWAVQNSSIIFVAVGTPENEDGSSDVRHVMEVVRDIAKAADSNKIVVIKSTVPIGTAKRVSEEINALTQFEVDVISNPEFLKEGAALEDFMKPDRVIIGTDEVRAVETLKELYNPFTLTGAPLLVMDSRSAEMTKYASNSMLACRVSFMNEIANLCEHLGADIHWVRQGIGTDRRIGSAFLFPGVGYGGSCFPKDIKALLSLAEDHHYPMKVVKAAQEANEFQKMVIVEKILKFYSSSSQVVDGMTSNQDETGDTLAKPLTGKTFAVWGLSFKPKTDDMREAPSLTIIDQMLKLGARVQVYDPEAMKTAQKFFGEKISYAPNNYEALKSADALILITEWNVFRNPNFEKVKSLLKHPVIFDGRNQYNPDEMRELGFLYFGIGRI
jgi:UDPglucose 6-dehydrogenase